MKKLIQLLKSVSDEARLRILNLLMYTGGLCVCDLQRVMGFSQTKVSRHLAYLRSSGLVDDHRRGLWIVYSLAPPKDEAHRLLLNCLKDVFLIYDVFQKDIETFEQAKAKGLRVSAELDKISESRPV